LAVSNRRKLGWAFALVLVGLILAPAYLVFQWDAEKDKDYWCSEAHYSTKHCRQAESDIMGANWGLIVSGLFLVAGILQFVLVTDQQAHAGHAQG